MGRYYPPHLCTSYNTPPTMRPSSLPFIDTCSFYKLNFFFLLHGGWQYLKSSRYSKLTQNCLVIRKNIIRILSKLVERVILPDSVRRDEVCREQPRLGLLFFGQCLSTVPLGSLASLPGQGRMGKGVQTPGLLPPWQQEPHTVPLAQKNKLYPHIHDVSSACTVGRPGSFPQAIWVCSAALVA